MRTWLFAIAFREFTKWRRKRPWLPLLRCEVRRVVPAAVIDSSRAVDDQPHGAPARAAFPAQNGPAVMSVLHVLFKVGGSDYAVPASEVLRPVGRTLGI